MKTLISRIYEKLRSRQNRRLLTRFVSITAAVVVFITTYALVLPAITMEEEALCGIPAHQHDDTCYERVLVCGMEESEDHVHTEDCYEEVLICGLEAHTHSAACYEVPEESADFEETEITEGLNSAAAVTSDLSDGEYLSDGEDMSDGEDLPYGDDLSYGEDLPFEENTFDGDSLSDEETTPVGDSLSLEENASEEGSLSVEESDLVEDNLSDEAGASFEDGMSDMSDLSDMSMEGSLSVEDSLSVGDSLSTEDDLSFEDEATDLDTMSVEGNISQEMTDLELTDSEQTDGQDSGSQEDGQADNGYSDDEYADSYESSDDGSLQEDFEEELQDNGDASASGDELNEGTGDSAESQDPADSIDSAEADSEADEKSSADPDEAVDADSENGNADNAEGTDADTPDAADAQSTDADAGDAAPTDTAANTDTNTNTTNTGKETGTVTNTETSTDAAAGTGSSGAAAVTPENSAIAQTGGINQAENTYTPVLDMIDFSRDLTNSTGIYYHKASGGEAVADSLAVTDWKKMDDAAKDDKDGTDSFLAPGDLIRIYLAYTIPAGSLNATNPVARYRLPSNLHLTDRQVEAINQTENGISKSYVDFNTLEITDLEKHAAYLGLEAVEGSRRPSDDREKYLAEHPEQDGTECVSATVKVENVFDLDESGRGSGDLIGQDLIITFSPYTIEKNRHGYDAGGQPTKAGETVSGWLTLDFNMQQVDWITTDTDTDVRSEDKADAEDTDGEIADLVDTAATDGENAEQADAGATDGENAEQADAEETDGENAEQEDAEATDGENVEQAVTEDTGAQNEDQEDSADKAETVDITDIADTKEDDAETDEKKEASEDKNVSGKQSVKRIITTTVRKKAKIVFAGKVKEDKKLGIEGTDEISTTLKMEEVRVEEIEASEEDESQEDDSEKAEEEDRQSSVRMPAVTFDQSIFVHGGKLGSDTDTMESAAETTTIKVHVEADEDTFPEGTTMVLANVTGDDLDSVAEAVENAVTSNDSVSNKTRGFHAVDISFRDANGKEIEPLKQIRVSMTSDAIKAAVEDKTTAPVVVHVEEEPTVMETIEESSTDLGKDANKEKDAEKDINGEKETEKENENGTDKDTEKETGNEAADTLTFDADSFSIYAIVYTVDFHWEVDGKTYEFSIPGGGFVSLEHLVEVLGIGIGEADGGEGTDSKKENDNEETAEDAQTAEDGSAAYDEAIALNEAEVSEAAKSFVSEVERIEFSSPKLVWVGKADEATTVGGMKDANRLEVEYSADLTEEQIAEINAQTVEAGDWALISVLPFLSEETLTATMKNGQQFMVKVTDGQIIRNVLTKDGKTYRITIAYDDEAGIPDGTQLVVREIEPGTDEYLQHLGKAWQEINKEYLEQEQKIKSYPDIPEDCIDIRPINLDQARFFDISLIYNDSEIEPKSAVQVDIKYVGGLKTSVPEEEQIFGVAHYMTNETELIGEVSVDRNSAGEIVEFSYEQRSFSGIGTFTGYQTSDKAPSDLESDLSMPGLRTLAKAIRNGTQLGDIEAHKHLNDNHDGTYTLSLTVKGDAVAEEKYNKTNVLFVMDRSSSMTKGIDYTAVPNVVPQSGVTYYGKSGGDYFTLGYYSYPTMFGTQYVFYNVNDLSTYTGTVYTGGTSRLVAEQQALSALFSDLLEMNDPDTEGKEDIIEISVISFADDRGKVSEGTEVQEWKHDKENDLNTLLSAVNNTNTPSGTNWEDALKYAKELADAKKQAQPDEQVFVVFLTDGEPTAIYGEDGDDAAHNGAHTGGAHHYDSYVNGRWRKYYDGYLNGQYFYGEHSTLGGFEYAYQYAKDDAKAIVEAGHQLYGIFTFNPGEDQVKYLKRLVNYAYTGVDKAYNDDGTDTDSVKAYFTNADTPQTLVESFNNIFTKISSVVGHGEVVITDGLQSPDAMTTTIEAGHAGGFIYKVFDENNELLYKVKVSDTENDGPSVTFIIDEHEYPAGQGKTGAGDKTYYSVKVEDEEYKIALADLTGRTLTWDLGAIGIFEPGYTYEVDIVVWPNQAAYDYVAGLNNHLRGYTWNESVESDPDHLYTVTVDGTTYEYYTGGVSDHPSIVKDKATGVYSVRTNTEQQLDYSIVTSETNEVTGETTTTSVPQDPIKLEPQKPMDLLKTDSYIEKKWNVERDPDILKELLFNQRDAENRWKPYSITFAVYRDLADGVDPEDEEHSNPESPSYIQPYTSVTLGWNGTTYEWLDEEEDLEYVDVNGTPYPLGTRWGKDFSIATGLMLSEEQMDARELDKEKYPQGIYDGVKYWILETGHEYTLVESPKMGYEFDFIAPKYHPMLVDGVLRTVNFTISGKSANISNMSSADVELSSLKAENTLRGYIHLNKVVVDKNGNPVPTDDTKFTYSILLQNDKAPFDAEHIPWYGINSLFYHDENYNYYQAVPVKDEPGHITLTIEGRNEPVDATCEGTFDPDFVGPTEVTFTVDGKTKTIQLYGNQLTESADKKTAQGMLKITQNEVLNIANVPLGTKYTIIEESEYGYELIDIDRVFDPDDVQEIPETETTLEEGKIWSYIVTNHDNHVIYTNRTDVTDIKIQKLDSDGNGLAGALFQLKSVNGLQESNVTNVEGLGTVTKVVNGETKTFESAFDSTGDVQKLKRLADGTYRLYEVYVPAGYVCTFRYIQFKVEDRVIKDVTTETGLADSLQFISANDNSIAFLAITNTPGATLPNTGGPGTRLFTILGSIMILGAGWLLWRRRRLI